MKTNLRLLLVLCLGLATFGIPNVILTGCQSPSAQRRNFNTIYTMAASVDASYRAYLDLVIAGQLRTNAVPEVSEQYQNFQQLLRVAVAASKGNTNAIPPVDLITATVQYHQTLQAAKKGKI